MAGPLCDHSVVLLGSYGAARRAASVPGACALYAPRLAHIHHRSVNGAGFIDSNFGIGFYFFDRFFRTMTKRHRQFNWQGYRAAIERYGLEETELLSLRSCSKGLFQKAKGDAGK